MRYVRRCNALQILTAPITEAERMKIVVSFLKRTEGALYDSIKKFFYSNTEVEIYGRNLANHFKQGSHELHNNPEKLDDRLSHPDLAIVLLSQAYLNDPWLSNELSALVSLEKHRNKGERLVLVIQTTEITVRRNEINPLKNLKNKIVPSIDFRKDKKKAMQALGAFVSESSKSKGRVFIGHGGSYTWTQLRDFLRDRFNLDYEEFNRESVVGVSNKERLRGMLDNSSLAFVVMTAEDEHVDTTKHARENVIHEIGLFQGKLGFHRTIVLLEEGCSQFSNIEGQGQIRFPKNNILAKAEEIRGVLERERFI